MANPTTDVRSKKDILSDPRGPRNPEEVIAAGLVDDIAADAPESVELQNTIENANTLLGEKAEVLGKIQSARVLSTLLIENGSGSREQAAWVRFYLPRKKRKGEDGETEDEGEE
jgi:hypothetical protein